MRNTTTTLAIGFLTLLITPAAAQKAEIEAANVKWMEFFSKGDFDGGLRSIQLMLPRFRLVQAW